jgi:segregation and condensation protein A
MEPISYTVKLESFEGPLDLLLHLVKTNEVDIYHLPIATITDQYLEYVGLFEELNLDVAGEYLVMAATLMYLKSKLLLPVDENEEDEPLDELEADLVRQLAEYQRFREAGEELRDRLLLGRDVFRRQPCPPDREEEEDPALQPVDLANLFEALRRVLSHAAARKPHVLSGEEVHVADAVTAMVDRLRSVDRLEFERLFGDNPSRPYIIATFIGLLELIKLRIVSFEQESAGAPILLKLEEHDIDDTLATLAETYGGRHIPALMHESDEGGEDAERGEAELTEREADGGAREDAAPVGQE